VDEADRDAHVEYMDHTGIAGYSSTPGNADHDQLRSGYSGYRSVT